MFNFYVALLAATFVPFARAQNETFEAAVSFLIPDYCVSQDHPVNNAAATKALTYH